MTPKETRKRIDEYWQQDSHGSNKVVYTLAVTLPDNELLDLVEDYYFNRGVAMVVGRERNGSPRYSMFLGLVRRRGLEHRLAQRQNKPIEATMKELSSEGCKRKGLLREQLKTRYRLASENGKRKIVLFMLHQPTKKERQWAYSKISRHWEECYSEGVVQAFESGDNDAATAILAHFPTEYIYRHRDRLASIKGLDWVYKRIGAEHPEEVRLDRLTPTEKLRTILSLRMEERYSDIEKMMYRSIASEVSYILTWGEVNDSVVRFNAEDKEYFRIDDFRGLDGTYYWNYWLDVKGFYLPRYFGIEDKPRIGHDRSLLSFDGVGLALWAMGQLGMAEAIVRFAELNKVLAARFFVTKDDAYPELVPSEIRDWLMRIYQMVNVGMLGESPLPDKYRKLLSFEELQDMQLSTETRSVQSVEEGMLEEEDVPF